MATKRLARILKKYGTKTLVFGGNHRPSGVSPALPHLDEDARCVGADSSSRSQGAIYYLYNDLLSMAWEIWEEQKIDLSPKFWDYLEEEYTKADQAFPFPKVETETIDVLLRGSESRFI